MFTAKEIGYYWVMDNLSTALKRFDALTRRWKPEDDLSFEDYARLLVLTSEVKRLTAEQAIQRPQGFDRELLVRLHNLAAGMEKTARSNLASFVGYGGPGGTA